MTTRFPVPRLGVARVAAALLTLAVVGGGVGFGVAAARPRAYESDRQALIRVWSIDALVLSGQTNDVSSSDLADAATVVTSADVLSAAAGALAEGGVTEAKLADAITASASQTSDFVQIAATGPSAAEADRRAQVVADAFVTVVRRKVLSSAAQISALTAGGSNGTQSDIQLRAQAIAAVDPVQIYRTGTTTRTGLAPLTATGVGGVAGLTMAALIVVLVAFAAPRLRRPDDVADALGLPALSWSNRSDPVVEDGLAADLIRAAGEGSVAVCPARPQDAEAATEFAAWLSGTGPDQVASGGTDRSASHDVVGGRTATARLTGVVRIDSPVEGLAAARPLASDISTTVLVTSAGTPTGTIARAASLLEGWRPVDAVVLVG